MSESHPERREDARHVSRAPAPGPRRRRMAEWWGGVRPLLIPLSIVGAMLVLGASAARDPEIESSTRLGEELRLTRSALLARQGELELARLEMNRLSSIVDYSARYRIPADLATAIFDMATTEGVEPALAFSLIRVESGFTRRAVSSAGAVGYTQVMPSTAYWLQPGIGREELFDRDINLRLGF
ncbi:MAG TPA: transglycosylase SLT domain-containing protein, partial [Longimicrobiales bacterium]|nr:transglycosylase SLT domain-containing protein [Longimicrobiales bacterium]